MSKPQSPGASVVHYKAALRRAIRRNAKDPEVDFLNITAMLDMMTIILVFLLKNMSSSNAAPPQSDDLKLAVSVLSTPPREEGIAVFVTKSTILVGDDPNPVITLPGREALATSGVDARHKPSPNSLEIIPLRNALQAVRDVDQKIKSATGKQGEKSEAIIIADAQTPYRLLLEVLYTLGQAQFGKFHLMVMTGSAKAASN